MPNLNPSVHLLDIIRTIKAGTREPVRIAEVGVDRGATTRAVAELLTKGDVFDLYDRETCRLAHDLDALKAMTESEINFYGNTPRLFDSYAWTIGRQMLARVRSGEPTEIWDCVYLDGAHTFPIDAPTACCLKEMIKPGGYLVFDDMNWTLGGSPTCNNPEYRSRFNSEQMGEAHVSMVVDLFMRPDGRFEELTKPLESRSVFRRIGG